ncbi:unnamed protein product [Durusdinium trenchii]|uniref:Uncharacterized protein n=1 Tax=Durusdinium trenchii TaxID=1381693 RepID=A0ABP0KMF8_9DINO
MLAPWRPLSIHRACVAAPLWRLHRGPRGTGSAVQFHPPGHAAPAEKVSAFRGYLHRTVEKKQPLEILPWGPEAVRNSLQLLASAPAAVCFEVEGRKGGSEKELQFHFRSLDILTWEDYLPTRVMNSRSLAVTEETSAVKLSRDLVSALQLAPEGEQAVRAFGLWDDETGINVLVKALAMAPSLYPFKKLRCVANVVNPVDDPRSRIFLYLTFGAFVDPPSLSDRSFVAYPPGKEPDPAALKRFYAAVQDQIHQGNRVQMDCMGADAILHAVRALSLVKGFTAEFRVEVTGKAKPQEQSGSEFRPSRSKIRFRAWRGQTWDDFNAIDFAQTSKRIAREQTPIDKLGWAVLAEVRKSKAVALHCFSDETNAVAVAIRALAALPRLTSGRRFYAVPSFGRAGADQRPVLRFYVRRFRGAGEADGDGAADGDAGEV